MSSGGYAYSCGGGLFYCRNFHARNLEEFLDEKKAKGVFLDANVLIFRHCSTGEKKDVAPYYQKAIECLEGNSISKIYVHSTVVSEFAFVSFRRFFDLYSQQRKGVDPKWKNKHRKEYRGTAEGKEVIEAIANECQSILSLYETIKDGVDGDEMKKVTEEYKRGNIDFIDCIIADICRKHQLALMTDDADFAHEEDLPIITANHYWLKKNRER